MKQPICYDLYCGLGGWTEAFIEEGYRCIGFDIEAHDYGTGGYPGELRIRDVRSIHGSELRDAAVIVGSSPCQEFSYRAMPWKRAKALPPPYLGMELFNAQFRIQREACEAAGRHIPMVVENVRGAQKWVGRAPWNYGSFYLWGDVPALMPHTFKGVKANLDGTAHPQGSWFAIADSKNRGSGVKCPGNDTFYKGGGSCGKLTDPRYPSDGRRVSMNFHEHAKTGKPGRSFQSAAVEEMGTKQPGLSGVRNNGKGDGWFQDGSAAFGSKSNARKLASAMIAKIPRPLALHIARAYKPAALEATA